MEQGNLLILTRGTQDKVAAMIIGKKLIQRAKALGFDARVSETLDDLPIDVVIELHDGQANLNDLAEYKVFSATVSEANQASTEFLQNAIVSAKTIQSTAKASSTVTQTSAKRFVAITACPTGVAHTFMAADALKHTAEKLGYQINVETQGSVGARTPLSPEAIEQADIVILATDIEVNTDRFIGKRVYRCGTGAALKQTELTFAKAIDEAQVLQASKQNQNQNHASDKSEKTGVYKHLLTGVSYMLPMVVAGGLLIAISFAFALNPVDGTFAAALKQIGIAAFTLMVPMLAGYIAYSIADRPGLAPGLIGGLLASQLHAGFLGGIAAGFIAGYVALFLAKKVHLPTAIEALKPILIIPLVASFITGIIMWYVVGNPVAHLFDTLQHFLTTMGTTNAILLGVLLGSMMCIDFGGPINKAAYAFTVGLLTSHTYAPMAATMAAGMVPPLGMAIATLIGRNKFLPAERDAGKAAAVLGLCFISEGAIPFAAKDPLRVIPASVVGGAIAGALSMLFQCQLAAPHGGLFVMIIPNAMNHPLMYLVAILAGSVATGMIYALLKQRDTALAANAA